jgi:chemotaxis signal transduction protein
MLCVAAERQVNEVIRAPQVTPFPLTPPWVEGLINLRGQIVPLVHLPLLTGFGRAHVPECLVVTVAGQLYAFRVSSLTGLRYAASEGVECEPAAETAGMPDVFTAFMDEGQLIHRLNFSTLVDSEPFGDIGQTLPTETTVHDG